MDIRRIVVRALVFCAVGSVFSVLCGSASAQLVHPFVSSFGSFSNVQGVATDAAGNLYVYDGNKGEILKFDPTGKPVNFTFTGTNAITGVGNAGSAEGEIAVDSSSGPAKGDIYVAHAGSSIEIYSAAGEKIGELTEGGNPWGEACGVAVDGSGNVYVGLYPEHVNKYVPAANPVTNSQYVSSIAGLTSVCNVAADSAGNVFVDRWSAGPITRYEPSQFGSLLSPTGSVVDGQGSTLAIDPANQEVYVDERGQISQFGAHGEPFENPILTFGGSGSGAIDGSIGIAVSPVNHDIYVSDGAGAISVFGPVALLPTVTTGAASSVTQAEATVSGTVNPEGVSVTGCQFEYGTTAAYGQTATCSASPGSGNTPVTETVVLAGLTPHTLYYYRLRGVNANGPIAGAGKTFHTTGAVVATAGASNVTPAEATIAGTINPERAAITDCRFEYGTTTAYGQTISCPTNPGAGNEPVEEAVLIAGLQPGTEYHYRLQASNVYAKFVGADRTFKTQVPWPETSTGLPDGRVYEEVSPPNKNGNEALPEEPLFVAANGDGALYAGNSGFGDAKNGIFNTTVVSERTSHGWVTRTAHGLPVAGPVSSEQYLFVGALDSLVAPSADLSHLLFGAAGDVPYVGPPDETRFSSNVYLIGSDPSAQPQWIARSQIEGAPAGTGIEGPQFANIELAGGSPDLKTIYFYYRRQSLPGASHLYEYKEGVLSDAGVLPVGETGGGEATPAAQPAQAHVERSGLIGVAGYDNEVSKDGSRIFFTREDETGTRELYVRVTAPDGTQSTKLVSRSQLSGHLGEPAPDGPVAVPSVANVPKTFGVEPQVVPDPPSYVYASPDGTHAFFRSVDRLTSDAPEDGVAKTYDFDVDTGTLEYLPGLEGSIVVVSSDGSSLVFENTSNVPASYELERWTAGPEGGTVTPIVALPSGSSPCGEVCAVEPAYMSSDGKVVVFATTSPIDGFNDDGTHYPRSGRYSGEEPVPSAGIAQNTEVFRYETEGNKLDCLSCPPRGTTPSSDAVLSRIDFLANIPSADSGSVTMDLGRAMSPDGKEVFFESRDALVPQDTNGKEDAYEWENGKLYLLSSGHSPESSFFEGISESGDDAFIMTSEGIAPGDRDGGYDVYDARIPRPGDNPPEAIPCTGSVCQGPPSVPQLLGSPASADFNGAGNITQQSVTRVAQRSLTRAQKLARALKQCHRHTNKRQRKRCEKQARTKYGSKSSRAARANDRHRNGRGN